MSRSGHLGPDRVNVRGIPVGGEANGVHLIIDSSKPLDTALQKDTSQPIDTAPRQKDTSQPKVIQAL